MKLRLRRVSIASRSTAKTPKFAKELFHHRGHREKQILTLPLRCTQSRRQDDKSVEILASARSGRMRLDDQSPVSIELVV